MRGDQKASKTGAAGVLDLIPAAFLLELRCYAVRMASDLSPEIAAWAAARRAMGTR